MDVGIPWYERDDYARLLEIMADAHVLPRTYDEWKQSAEDQETLIVQRGWRPVRVPLHPEKFLSWCMLRGLDVEAGARREFAGDPRNWPHKN